MSMIRLQNYAANKWISGEGKLVPIFSAVNGEQIAETYRLVTSFPQIRFDLLFQGHGLCRRRLPFGYTSFRRFDRHELLDGLAAAVIA